MDFYPLAQPFRSGQTPYTDKMAVGGLPVHDCEIVTLFCDQVTVQTIAEATCLRCLAIPGIAALRDELGRGIALALFIDATNSLSDRWLTALSDSADIHPRIVRIVIAGQTDDATFERAFIHGANDVIRKPIRQVEILSRLQARLRESAQLHQPKDLKVGDLRIDPTRRLVACGPEKRTLTQTTFSLLLPFLQDPNGRASRTELKRCAWPSQRHIADNALDRQIHELRKTLRDVGSSVVIKAVYGEGYALVPPTSGMKFFEAG